MSRTNHVTPLSQGHSHFTKRTGNVRLISGAIKIQNRKGRKIHIEIIQSNVTNFNSPPYHYVRKYHKFYKQI